MMELVQWYRGLVFGLCYRMLGNRHDAEDAAQETFLRMLRSLHRWDPNREFEPWLLAIASNRCRTALAARKRRRQEQPLVEHPWECPDRDSSTEQLAEEVERGLGLLRNEYREAFVLFHEHGLSYEQISTAVRRPLGTVKTWIHRARRELIGYLLQREVLTESHHVVRGF